MSSNANILAEIKSGNRKTIQVLLDNLLYSGRKLCLSQRVSFQDYQEAVIDSVMLFLEKIKAGKYKDAGVPVNVYLMKILRFKLLTYMRRSMKNNTFVILEESAHYYEEYEENDRLRLVEKQIRLLRPPERELIELTYFTGMSDKEIYENDLTIYSSIDSIKTQRYKIIKKLIKMVKTNHTKSRYR